MVAAVTSATSPLHLVTALSHDGLLAVAVIDSTRASNSWRVGLYRNGVLQSTLTPPKPSPHSNDAQALLKPQLDRSPLPFSPPIPSRLFSLFFLHPHLLVGVSSAMSQGDVVIWDLHRGVVSTSFSTRVAIADVATASTNSTAIKKSPPSTYYLLLTSADPDREEKKSVIQQYQNGNTLVRKIKTKRAIHLVATEAFLVVVMESGHGKKLRAMDVESGKVVQKISLPDPVLCICSNSPSASSTSSSSTNTVTAVLESGAIVTVDLDQGGMVLTQGVISSVKMRQQHQRSSLEYCSSGEGISLIIDGQFFVTLDHHDTHGAVADPSSSSSSPPLAPLLKSSSLVDWTSVQIGRVLLDDHNNLQQLVAVLYNAGSSIQVHTRPLRTLPTPFTWRHNNRSDPTIAVSSVSTLSQRSSKLDAAARVSVTNVNVLGPAQSGETLPLVSDAAVTDYKELEEVTGEGEIVDDVTGDERAVKRSKPDEDVIATRLAQIREQLLLQDDDDNDEGSESRQDSREHSASISASGFQPKKATTESLSQLIPQALSDDSLLELVLTVTNVNIIQESVKSLSITDISALTAAISARLAFKPARADCLVVWLRVLLQTRKVPIDILQPLQNLIQDRIQIFPDLLKLEGRLSLLNP